MSSVRSISLFISLLCTLSVFTPAVWADKKSLTPMQKGFEQCLLDGGETSTPADNKGATCCFPKSSSCITCVGAYCSAGKNVSVVKDKHQSSVVGTTGVVVPKNETEKDKLKNRMQGQVDAPTQVERAPVSRSVKGSVKDRVENSAPEHTE